MADAAAVDAALAVALPAVNQHRDEAQREGDQRRKRYGYRWLELVPRSESDWRVKCPKSCSIERVDRTANRPLLRRVRAVFSIKQGAGLRSEQRRT